MSYFGFDASMLPGVVFVDMSAESGMRKYPFPADDEINASTLAAFSDRFHAGQLRPFLKSAAPEDDSDQHVKVLVGSQFNERVLENQKDVLGNRTTATLIALITLNNP